MVKSVIILALAVTAVLAVPHSRSPRPQLDGRIVGGNNVNIEEYPHQISLQYSGRHICGASIAAPNIAVTAAHCTDGSSASSLSIRAGSSIRGSGGQVVQVKEIKQNPNYDWWSIDYDVSVLILSEDIVLGNSAQPIALPQENEDVADGAPAEVSGWGTTSEGGSLPSQLQAVEVGIVGLSACRDAYGKSSITDRMICAGVNGGGKDACQGDSGGPLISGGKLVGVVSWGYGCARPSHPGVYASVPNLRGFIASAGGV